MRFRGRPGMSWRAGKFRPCSARVQRMLGSARSGQSWIAGSGVVTSAPSAGSALAGSA